MNSQKTAVIIGGGFAGLSAAVFLDAIGLKVTLLEKKPILGGRAYAFQDRKTGSWVDNGQHLLIGAYHETLKLLENIGATRHLFFQPQMNVPLISDKDKFTRFQLPHWPAPLNFLAALFRMKIFGLREKLNFLKLGRELKRIKKDTSRHSLDQTVEEWLAHLGQSLSTRTNFWDPLTLAALNDAPNVAGARMLAAVLTRGFLGTKEDSRMILPRSNLNDLLANPARIYLEARGQTIRTSTGVTKLHILDNKVCTLELDSGETLKADFYFSAVPFTQLLRMIPPGFAESIPYFENLTRLKTAPIVSINLWYDRDILPHDFIGTAGRQIHWFFNKNRIYDETHPPYHYMGVVSGAYSFIDKSKDEIMEIALNELRTIAPESKTAHLIHSLVNKEREATLSPQVGSENFRPKQKSPFSNFYVVGDWTNTGLPATIESAVLSARLAVDELEKSINLHQ